MTKVIILGEEKKEVELNKIEFVRQLEVNYSFNPAHTQPNKYKTIELICRDYDRGEFKSLDLMFAFEDNRSDGTLYLGHFNDGVV